MKERTIILNTLSGDAGEVLDRNRTHVIRKEADGCIYARFHNPTQEISAVKLTLTALTPYTSFDISINGKPDSKKRANEAGILECRFPLPGLSQMEIREMQNTQKI